MKVQAKHGKVTQNMHGASRNYRYVWDVSRTSKRHTSTVRLKHASSVSIQLFTSFFILFQKNLLLPLGVPLFEFGCSLTQKSKMCSSDHSHQQKQHTLGVRVLPHPEDSKSFE